MYVCGYGVALARLECEEVARAVEAPPKMQLPLSEELVQPVPIGLTVD